jgi:type IV pilus assembly protein PilE
MQRASSGFSLIELMIVCVIIAILGSIAIPSYNTYIRQSRRTEAKTALMDLAAREERYLATQSVYTSSGTALQYATGFPVATANYYNLNVAPTSVNLPTSSAPATFTATATPSAGSTQLKDTNCQTFQIDQTGKQTSTNSSGADSTSTCWP